MFKSFILIGIAFFNLVAANNEFSVNQSIIYQQIIENEPDAILFITEDKLYLHHEMIHISSQGIFVGKTPIEMLNSDATGCWLQRPVEYWICSNPDCANYQKVFSSSSGKCPVCRREGDPG